MSVKDRHSYNKNGKWETEWHKSKCSGIYKCWSRPKVIYYLLYLLHHRGGLLISPGWSLILSKTTHRPSTRSHHAFSKQYKQVLTWYFPSLIWFVLCLTNNVHTWLVMFPAWFTMFLDLLDLVPVWLDMFPVWLGIFKTWLDMFLAWLDIFPAWLEIFHSWLNMFSAWLDMFQVILLGSICSKFDVAWSQLDMTCPKLDLTFSLLEFTCSLLDLTYSLAHSHLD